MTERLPTLSEAVKAYRQAGHRLRTGEPFDPANEEVLKRLDESEDAAKAFAGIAEEAQNALAKRLEEEEKAFIKGAEKAAKEEKEAEKKFFAKNAEEEKAFVKRAEKTAKDKKEAEKKFFAKNAEEAAKALANSAEEAKKTFARKAPFLIDDCVEAQEIYAGKHQVERLSNTRSAEEMWTKLAELAIHIGASDAHDIEAIRMMGVALGYRQRHLEYERLSTSRRGDDKAARSKATAWIKSSVLRLSGKSPLTLRIAKSDIDHIIALCDIVFKTTAKTAISERSVRRATTKEEWLNRRFPRKESRRLKKYFRRES